MSKIDTTASGVEIEGIYTKTQVDNKFVADQAIPLINPFATPFTWNDIASQNFVNTRNFLTLDDVYPIGSIYFTASSVQPGTSIGGTWVRYAQGKCLFGVDDYDSDFSSVEQIGGEKTHTLTKAEIPPHKHIETRMGFDFNPVVSGATSWRPFDNPANEFETSDGSLNLDGTSQLQGLAHNNMPPYIAIHIWKRIA